MSIWLMIVEKIIDKTHTPIIQIYNECLSVCGLNVFVKCLITAVINWVVVLVFRLVSDSVIIIMTLTMKLNAMISSCKPKQKTKKHTRLKGLYRKTGNSSVNVKYTRSVFHVNDGEHCPLGS